MLGRHSGDRRLRTGRDDRAAQGVGAGRGQNHAGFPKDGQVQGWNHDNKGDVFKVDATLDSAGAKEFDALLLPGGVANPDKLRMTPKAVGLSRASSRRRNRSRPSATAMDAGRDEGSPRKDGDLVASLKTDIVNAGGNGWIAKW